MPLLKGYSLFPNPGLGNQSRPCRSEGNVPTTPLYSSCLDANAHNVEELLVTYKPLPSLPTSLLSLLALLTVVGYWQTFTQHDLLIKLSWFLTVTFLLLWLKSYAFDYTTLYDLQPKSFLWQLLEYWHVTFVNTIDSTNIRKYWHVPSWYLFV